MGRAAAYSEARPFVKYDADVHLSILLFRTFSSCRATQWPVPLWTGYLTYNQTLDSLAQNEKALAAVLLKS